MPDSETNPETNQTKSNRRDGARPGASRKPRAVTGIDTRVAAVPVDPPVSSGAANQPKSTRRGGARPGAGRKPRAVPARDVPAGGPVAMVPSDPPDLTAEGAAQKAFELLAAVLQDPTFGVTTRLWSAKQILDRIWGRAPRASDRTDTEPPGRVVIYLPHNGREPLPPEALVGEPPRPAPEEQKKCQPLPAAHPGPCPAPGLPERKGPTPSCE